MKGTFIKIRGKSLYVEIHGNEESPPLLYLHGGPGESCYEFMIHQADRLSEKLRLISMDQRGVWRSEAIEEDEPLTIYDLVEDCEQLRRQLGIQKWAVLGHSFGGLLGVLYAIHYPNSVSSLILEGPSFDLIKSIRSWLRKAASLYESIGDAEKMAACIDIANGAQTPPEILDAFIELGQGLGDLRMKVYTPNGGSNYTKMIYSEREREEFGRRTNIHVSKIFAEGRIFDSLLPKLKELTLPVLLIKGRHDPIICEEQTDSFVNDVRNGHLKVYEESGHLLHFEEPERFAMDVIQFILESNHN
ncbi:alpha/beta hydrolase [Paenibacillus sp. FSL M8-0142]|uniref:alpha/beta fold hydrolase n=1 Tax=Paenibacillus sp. FSL M8-0142 TaxID=2954525 RepID=UPI00315B2270